MSHKGTNWAIQQRGLKPATKLVLWHLCDRHNPDIGCFPSQDQLAADAEVSRSQLNVHLAELEDVGLIKRQRRVDPRTKRQLRTRYLLGFEDDFGKEPLDPEQGLRPETGHGFEDAGADLFAEPGPEIRHGPGPESGHGNGKSRVRNPDSIINPVKSKKEEEGACVSATGCTATSRPPEAAASALTAPAEALFEAFFEELLRSVGHDPQGPLPGWWQGWPARQHARRWMTDYGFGEARIVEIAKATRRDKPEPPDGPKALDAAMARAHRVMLDKASRATGRAPTKPGRIVAGALTRQENFDEIVRFHADWVNSDRFLPSDAIKADVGAAMIERGLATIERLRSRGVR